MPSITRKAQSDRAARTAEMRARMLEAVEKLLDEAETFTELSVERIVAEAGISRSTFYVYFEDKGHLLRVLTGEALELILAASRAWWARIEEADYAALEAGIGNLIEIYREHAPLLAAIVDTSVYDADVRAEFHAVILGGEGELAEQIRRGQRAKIVRPELDPERTATWLAWMVERGLYQAVRDADDAEAKRLASALGRLLWNAIYVEDGASATARGG